VVVVVVVVMVLPPPFPNSPLSFEWSTPYLIALLTEFLPIWLIKYNSCGFALIVVLIVVALRRRRRRREEEGGEKAWM